MISNIVRFSSIALLCTQLTGCFLECPEGTSYSCTEYGSVTECRPTYGGGTRCESRLECVNYACVGDYRPAPRPGPYPGPHPGPHPGPRPGPRPPRGPRGFVLLNENTAFETKRTLGTLELDEAMAMTANGDIENAYNIGLESKDLMKIISGSKLEADRLQSIASINGMSADAVNAKLNLIRDRLETERKDMSSAYWQTCMAQGKWKTDKNRSCEKFWWPGCSPMEDASYCVSEAGAKRLQL